MRDLGERTARLEERVSTMASDLLELRRESAQTRSALERREAAAAAIAERTKAELARTRRRDWLLFAGSGLVLTAANVAIALAETLQ